MNYFCIVRQKEFSRKAEISKVESLYHKKLSNKGLSFELEQVFYLCFVLAVQGFTLITCIKYHCCVVGQKDFQET